MTGAAVNDRGYSTSRKARSPWFTEYLLKPKLSDSMRRTAPILWSTIGCKNTRSNLLMRLRFLQPMQPH